MADSYYDYSQYNTNTQSGGLNLFEKFLIIITLVPLIIGFAKGFADQNVNNKDDRKRQDISEVMKALDLSYINSGPVENNRKYPISRCSGQLNEVDFEYTLNLALTGRDTKNDTNVYINPKDYPTDPFGDYSTKKIERKTPFRNCPSVQKIENDNLLVYKSGQKSCNFQIGSRYLNCYIYSTDQNGTSYKIGYYSEPRGGFIIWDKFKNNSVVESFSAN
jgi:hypothetical protein